MFCAVLTEHFNWSFHIFYIIVSQHIIYFFCSAFIYLLLILYIYQDAIFRAFFSAGGGGLGLDITFDIISLDLIKDPSNKLHAL